MAHHYEEQDEDKVKNDIERQPPLRQPTPEEVFGKEAQPVNKKYPRKVEDEKFWMVWKNYGDGPKIKHVTEESANREAERIAHERTTEPVYVLEAVRVFRRATPPVERHELQ